MLMNVLMLSPCGTSLLTKQMTGDFRKNRNLITKYANEKESGIPNDDLDELNKLIKRAKQELFKIPVQKVSSLSAELNAIIKYYDGQLAGHSSDIHYLLSTDTWLGENTANLVKEWLEKQGFSVQVLVLKDLRTDNLESFQLALSDFVKWCEETLPGYRENKYRVVFNLTGGFKSVQGFLQTLAMFYADEAIYVFESGKELLKLPKLPVKFVPDEVIEQHLNLIRRLALNLPVEDVSVLPEILIMKFDNEAVLSPWGELVWGRVRNDLYVNRVYHPPTEKVVMTEAFQKSVKDLPADRIRLINQRVDDLSEFAELGKKYNKKRLDFKELKGSPVPGSTHEIDAWADRDAKRIFCHIEEGKIILDKLDKALH
ncbi:MAG: putative CRISPR-associated protein [Balneolaceae bacterium]|nr:putative CRISPR-associated protein [Balneolaceae bacterium]